MCMTVATLRREEWSQGDRINHLLLLPLSETLGSGFQVRDRLAGSVPLIFSVVALSLSLSVYVSVSLPLSLSLFGIYSSV